MVGLATINEPNRKAGFGVLWIEYRDGLQFKIGGLGAFTKKVTLSQRTECEGASHMDIVG